MTEKIFKSISKALLGIDNFDPAVKHWWLDPENKANLTNEEMKEITNSLTEET